LERNKTKSKSKGTAETVKEVQEKPSINGFLDHARQSLQILDQSIADAQQMSHVKTGRGHDNESRLEWTRELRNLIELRNSTLQSIKHHMLGRDYDTGQFSEPEDIWQFERDFHKYVTADPWTQEDLELECEECHKSSIEVEEYDFDDEKRKLCEPCHEKATSQQDDAKDEPPEPISAQDVKVLRQSAALQIKVLRTFPIDQRIAKLEELLADKPEVAPGMEPAYEAYRDVLQKELDNAKATREHAAHHPTS